MALPLVSVERDVNGGVRRVGVFDDICEGALQLVQHSEVCILRRA
jgi:hypothetical protein